MRIRTLFGLYAGITIGLIVAIGAVILTGLGQVNETLKAHDFSTELVKDISQLQSRSSEYLLRPSLRASRQWRDLEFALTGELAQSPFTSPERLAEIQEINERIALASRLFNRLFDLSPPAADPRSEAVLDASLFLRWEADATSLQLAIQEALSEALSLREFSHNDLGRVLERSGLTIILLVTVSGMTLAALLIFMHLRVVVPVDELSRDVKSVTAGDVQHRSSIASRNELGDFGRTFNAMLDRLQTITVSRDTLAVEVSLRNQAESNLRAFLEAVEESAFLITIDGTVLFANRVTGRRLGRGETLLEGSNMFDLIPPQVAQSRRLHVNEVIATKTPIKFEDTRLDRIIENHIYPVVDGSDKVTHLAVIGFDVTERRNIEKALIASEDRLRTIVNQLPIGVSLLDFNRSITFENPALKKISHLTGDDIVSGKHLLRRYLRADGSSLPPEEFASQRALREGSAVYNVETGVVLDDGSVAWTSVSAVPFDTGRGDELLISTVDITERKQLEVELRRSNEELERFAYIASHDLQEPLRMVTSFMQLLERRHGGQLDGEAREYIDFAVDGARRMQRLINDLLTYSRVNSRGVELVPTDAEAALDNALANLGLAIDEQGAAISRDPLPRIQADLSQLSHVFQNFIGNALKFHGPESVRVHVSAQRQGGEWVFSVRDNGIGIEPRHFERIFEVFQRLHSSEEYPGTGIGLAVCKRIVTRHGGRIWVESAPGAGTTFFFTLRAIDGEVAS